MIPREDTFLGLATDGFHKISYVDWGNTDSSRVAICVHGLSRNGRDFDYLAKALAEQGYRVICPDMPGRGKSDWLPIAADYNLITLSHTLVTLINKFRAEELVWIGTSMGGLLGMLFASRVNTPINKLILNDIGPHLKPEPLKRISQYVSLMPSFKTIDLAKNFLRQILIPFGVTDDTQLNHMVKYSFTLNEAGEYRLAYDPNILATFETGEANLWPFWDPIQCPTLIIRGENSEILTRETAEKMIEKPNTTLIEFSNVAHAPALMDANQIEAIIKWINT